ncbi:MAG: hypothetical protein PHY16_00090 [Methylobacter sp.]|nr:hypothetical protein [Methylobacter sp.]
MKTHSVLGDRNKRLNNDRLLKTLLIISKELQQTPKPSCRKVVPEPRGQGGQPKHIAVDWIAHCLLAGRDSLGAAHVPIRSRRMSPAFPAGMAI